MSDLVTLCKNCGRSNCANPGWPSWMAYVCMEIGLERERARIGTLERANAMLEEDRKREKARADALAGNCTLCQEALESANAEVGRAWRSNNENVESLASAKREIEELRVALRDGVFTPTPR